MIRIILDAQQHTILQTVLEAVLEAVDDSGYEAVAAFVGGLLHDVVDGWGKAALADGLCHDHGREAGVGTGHRDVCGAVKCSVQAYRQMQHL